MTETLRIFISLVIMLIIGYFVGWYSTKTRYVNRIKAILPDAGGFKGMSLWWDKIEQLYHKDTGGCIDKTDPEYSAQKIYKHWLHHYL